MNRLLLIAALSVAGALSLEARTTPLEMEEASEAARRAATAAIHGPSAGFLEALDVDALLENRLGTAVWRGLTATDREVLRATLRERFHGMLAPPRPVPGEVAWSAALSRRPTVAWTCCSGLNMEGKTLKTRWVMRRSGSLWRVRDVVLSDPGISLAGAALATLGSQPVALPAAGGRRSRGDSSASFRPAGHPARRRARRSETGPGAPEIPLSWRRRFPRSSFWPAAPRSLSASSASPTSSG